MSLHDVTASGPVAGPAVWRGRELDPAAWAIECDRTDLAELDELVRELGRRKVTLNTASAPDFDRDVVRRLAARIGHHLDEGPGFAVLRTWPVREWGVEAVGTLFWGLGSRVGSPLPQNERGDRLSAVRRQVFTDTAMSESARRGSHSDQEIDFHTENAAPPVPPRTIALSCCTPAVSGGESALVSGLAVHNRLLRRDPDLVAALKEPFLFGRRPGVWPDGRTWDEQPVFTDGDDGLVVRFNRYWLEQGVEAARRPWSDRQRAAVEAFEAAAHELGTAFVHRLRAGETLWVNNRSVLHSRQAFTDGDGSRPGRMLWRLWCS